ncbi:MAG TPA: hypothetical protein VG125_33525 [Pirellulales bacterium]|nr:hypothetical protein [Pirellulales bacterium]
MTLDAIRSQAPSHATTGPLAEGLRPEDRLVIASFYDRENRQRYQDLLLANGVGSSWERRDRQDQVLVDMDDRVAAARLLDEHLAAWPDRPQARGRRVVDFILLGAVLGATISTSFVADRSFARNEARWGLLMMSALAFTVYGAIVGGLLGSVRERLAQHGRLQFTILDLLLLAALVALAALVWRLA